MATEVTKSEYARITKVSPAYVSKLVREGKVVLSADGKKIVLDESIAKQRDTADPSKIAVKQRWEKEREAKGQGISIIAPPKASGSDSDEYDYQEARAKRETHLASIAEFDERKRRGELLESAEVARALTDYALASRVALEQIPDRLAGLLATETDPEAIYKLIQAEVDRVIDEIYSVASALPEALAGGKQ